MYYDNVAVVDTYKENQYGGEITDKDNDEEKIEGDWFWDLIPKIINFFKNIYNWFVDHPYMIFIVIGVIAFFLCLPLITMLINFIKSITS